MVTSSRQPATVETPVLGVQVPHADAADGGHGAEEHPSRSEDPVGLLEDSAGIEDELQRLDEKEAIEGARWDRARLREVSDDCGVRVRLVDVDDVAAGNVGTERPRIARVSHLQNAPADRRSFLAEKSLDVPSVDRRPAV